ncbi:MAG: DNA polymerase III subunit chi [Gammaproteobacteria bacterium]|nr:MAG: DNA polymerase III subunit chi [Gammaproteobacteria bacterium]
MSRVDFYILPDQQTASLNLFTCRLVEKAWQQGNRILIHTASAEHSQQLDDLLWTFNDGSFIPHAISGDDSEAQQPIVISHQSSDGDGFQLLINLSDQIATQTRIPRIAEIVNQEPQRKLSGREHFKTYREQGFELHHHEIKSP